MDSEPFFKHVPIKWGIIGCGNVTEAKSGPAYQITEGFELEAVMRRNADLAKDYAKRHGVPKFYSNADDLINDDAIHGVYIATPPDSHKLYALKVAKANKPCCIEKPMAPSYADSLEIFNAFDKKRIPLFIAYYRRSLPRFEQLKSWIDAGEIGSVRHISWQLYKQPSKIDISGAHNWRTDAKIAPGGYFDDLASHGLDLFVHLLGEIKEAKGNATNQLGLYSAIDAVSACWLHQNGATGTGSWNFGSSQDEDKAEIIGSKGKLNFSIFHENPIVLQNDQGIISMEIPHPDPIQTFHVSNMRDHLMGTGRHPSLGASALHSSWVMDKILGVI